MLRAFRKFVQLIVSPFRSSVRCAVYVFALVAMISVASVHGQSVVYVDINNGVDGPPNFGRNGWGQNAHRFLQDALEAANALLTIDPETPVHLWVAQGMYLPDHSAATPDGSCDQFGICDWDATFSIPNNVTVFGGFAGFENTLDERTHDPTTTILSGRLFDGVPIDPQLSHSTHVVTMENTNSTARLDTVTIERGWQAGVLLRQSDAILSNCVITKNNAISFNSPAGVNAEWGGNPRLINCQFIENVGGGSPLTVSSGVSMTVVNSLFRDNTAVAFSPAVRVWVNGCSGPAPADVTLINCTIVNNHLVQEGGAVYRHGEGKTTIKNSIL